MCATVSELMDVSRPYAVISHPLDTSVLVVLAGTTMALTGREVSRLAPEGTVNGVWKALSRLVEQGLVERREAGRAALYTLNREHLAAPAALTLAGIRTELLNRVRERLAEWEIAPLHASLFGSTARGDGDASSDIDLFIVRPREVDEEDPVWRRQLDLLAEALHAWTGNHAGIVEVGEEDVEHLRSSRPAIVDELEADAIDLTGSKLTDILAHA